MNIQRCLLSFIVAATLAAAQSNNPDTALGAARHLEEAEGNYPAAIQAYKNFLTQYGKNRPLAAKALVRLGQCYEKLGDAESRKVYERVVREFGDQREIVAQARELLAALSRPADGSAIAVRQLWTGKMAGAPVLDIVPTLDGRELLFVSSGDAATRDLLTGEIRRLGFKNSSGESSDFVEFPLYSPDHRQIAYAWFSAAQLRDNHLNGYQLRVVSTEPGAKPRELIKFPKFAYFKPVAWSPDGKAILTLLWWAGKTTIAWISATDGSVKTLKSIGWLEPFDGAGAAVVSLSPDGRYIAYDVFDHKGRADRDIYILASDGSSETLAVKGSGSNSSPVWTPDGTHLVFTSSRSRNIGLFAVPVRSGEVQGTPKLLKADTGQITLCGFVRSGALYYLQSSGEQNVYRAELDPVIGRLRNTPVPLASTYTTNNSMSALSPDGKRVAYLATPAW